MKSLHISLLSVLLFAFSGVAFAQKKTEKINVAGECGMCKKTIEKAAKSAGASYAAWDMEKKELTVTYNTRSSSTEKIEKAIAAAGYDTQNFKASDEAYDNLHACCKYERTSTNEAKACCKDGDHANCDESKCDKTGNCCKEGKCEHHAGEDKKACCKKS